MLASSLLLGLVPLIVVSFNGNDAPFMFAAAWNLGGFISTLLYLSHRNSELLSWDKFKSFAPRNKSFFKTLRKISENELNPSPWNWQIILALLPPLGVVFYSWSFSFLPEVSVAVLGETWPLFVIIFLPAMVRKTKESLFNIRNILLSLFTIGGVTMVIFSVNADGATAISSLDYEVIVGLIFVAIWVLITVMEYWKFGWIENIHKSDESKEQKAIIESKTDHILFLSLVTYFWGFIMSFIVVLFTHNSIGLSNFLWVLLLGMFMKFFVAYFWGAGTIESEYNPGTQSISYMVPLFGVIFLWMASHYSDVNSWLFFLGLSAIVVGNILMHFRTEDRFGLASLVVALWLAGWIVLFRDNQLDDWFGEGEWFLAGESYFAVLALSATAFTLLLAFRITRIQTRTSEEEQLVYSLLARFVDIKDMKQVSIFEQLEIIDKSKGPGQFRQAYDAARDKLDKLIDGAEPGSDDKKYLLESQAELDSLTHSKQYGREYGEPTAVVFLGLLTLVITLLTRPVGDGLTGVIFDGFSFVFAGTIAFLTLHIFDLQSERSISILEKHKGQDDRYRVEFREPVKIQEWWLSIASAVFILVVVSIMILQKWV